MLCLIHKCYCSFKKDWLALYLVLNFKKSSLLRSSKSRPLISKPLRHQVGQRKLNACRSHESFTFCNASKNVVLSIFAVLMPFRWIDYLSFIFSDPKIQWWTDLYNIENNNAHLKLCVFILSTLNSPTQSSGSDPI